VAEIGTDLARAKTLLMQGELVAIPTETVYGLAGNALNAEAVARIFEVKERPTFDPLIVHVPDWASVGRYASEVPPKAALLAENFWPGPLTLLLPKRQNIPSLVTSGLDTVGLRCPNHPLTRALLQQLDFPLAAPSANPFGYISPTSAAHVNAQLGNRIPYILDGGPCEVGIESTIVGFDGEQTVVHRLGGITVEQIEEVVGPVSVHIHSTSNPQAPGQLASHYAPRKPLLLGSLPALLQAHAHRQVGILSFQTDYRHAHQVVLSPAGNLREAAQKLFTALRELDGEDVDIILAERVPHEGLGRAINDRLQRAATPT